MAGMLKEAESTAQSLGTKLLLVPADSPADLDGTFAAMTRERADGLVVFRVRCRAAGTRALSPSPQAAA